LDSLQSIFSENVGKMLTFFDFFDTDFKKQLDFLSVGFMLFSQSTYKL